MCALVLALRKIPIYAPGGGDSILGSSDKPTYSVTVTDEQAAASREAFSEKKEGKRLVPSKKPEDKRPDELTSVNPTPIGGSSGNDVSDPHGPAVPSPLRYRLSGLGEANALNALNARNPAADTARDASDLINPDIRMSGSTTPHDKHRSAELDEVRGLPHRQSTHGKRKTQNPSTMAISGSPSIHRISESEAPRMEVEYSSYPPQTLDPYLRQPHSPALSLSRNEIQLPQVQTPVPGSGNAFAQQAREDRERENWQREWEQRQQPQQQQALPQQQQQPQHRPHG